MIPPLREFPKKYMVKISTEIRRIYVGGARKMVEYLLLSIIIGVISSVIASLLFLLFLTRVRPEIEISNQIAKGKSLTTGDTIYRIKVINKTRRPIINIKAQLHLVTPITVPGGILLKSKEIPLRRSEIMYLEKFDPNDENAEYAFRFVTYENIEEIWKDDKRSFLRFRICATDSISGFTKVFIKEYHTKSLIREGEFEFGNSMEIK
ncbi:hypothetical protein [Archaeoglobus veneficus]|uniref:hypothetical protein n=1 Tax=Archaeoglobus veneficus TaxID=58290 RepID=UPI0012EABCE9|nr:hypothetical protein [Archaeoglobus veneficus]